MVGLDSYKKKKKTVGLETVSTRGRERERERERERLHLIHYSLPDLALLYSSLIYNYFLVLAASCNAHILGGNPR